MRATLVSKNSHKTRELAVLLPGWSVDPIAVEQDVYMKFFTPDYNPIDPADNGRLFYQKVWWKKLV